MDPLPTERSFYIKKEPDELNDLGIDANDVLFEAKLEPVFNIKRENEFTGVVKDENLNNNEIKLFSKTNPEQNSLYKESVFANDAELEPVSDIKCEIELIGLMNEENIDNNETVQSSKKANKQNTLDDPLKRKKNRKKSTVLPKSKKTKKAKSLIGKSPFPVSTKLDIDEAFNQTCLKCGKKSLFGLSEKGNYCDDCDGKLEFQCLQCETVFTTNQNLYRHYQFCGKQANLSCLHCPYKARHQRNLDRHTKLIHPPRDETAQKKSEKDTKKKSNPRGHIFKYFKRYCPTCDKAIENKCVSNRRNCEVCDTDFHFICLQCDEKFEKYRRLYWHLNTNCKMTEIKKTECSNCGKKLKGGLFTIQKHIRYCKKNLEFTCNYCKTKKKYKYDLEQHIVTKHL